MKFFLGRFPLVGRWPGGLMLAGWISLGADPGRCPAGTAVAGPEPSHTPAVPAATPNPQPVAAAGLRNLYRLGPELYSGAAPEGEAGFAALRKLGVQTIISVDGSRPAVEAARQQGLRYVHLPHGYEGIPTELQHRLIRAARTLPGPIYVHCHRGRHRGPVSVAVIGLAYLHWTQPQALDWLKTAGTGTEYAGLYEVVRQFQPPSERDLKSTVDDFPAVAQVPGLVDAMVRIEQHAGRLKDYREAGGGSDGRTNGALGQWEAANTATLLMEQYREARRLPDAVGRGADFLDRLRAAECSARVLESLLRQTNSLPATDLPPKLGPAFRQLTIDCVQCHRRYRDSGR